MNCIVFRSTFLDVIRMLMSTDSFLVRLDSGILYMLNAFPWPVLLNNFKLRINKHNFIFRFLLNIFSCLLLIFFIFCSITPYLVVAFEPCMEGIPIRKKITSYSIIQDQCFHLAIQCNVLLSPEEYQSPGHQGREHYHWRTT